MLKLLSAVASFSRMVSAMAPVTRLRPRDFKLTPLVSLAYLLTSLAAERRDEVLRLP